MHTLVTLVVTFASLLTLTVSTIVVYRTERHLLMGNTLEHNRLQAERIAETADEMLRSLKTGLQAVSMHVATHPEPENHPHYLESVRKSHNFNVLAIVDADGFVVDSTPPEIGLNGRKLTSEAATEALRRRKPSISEPFVGLTNRLMFLVSHPVFDAQGNYLGFVGGTIYLHERNAFEALFGTHPYSETGSFTYVVSASGELMYHPDATRIGENVSTNRAVRETLAGRSGATQIRNTLGIEMLAGYAPVRDTGWGVVSQTPLESVARSTRRIVTSLLQYATPMVLLLVVVIHFFIRFLTSPLYQLATYAERATDEGEEPSLPAIHGWSYEANQLYGKLSASVSRLRVRLDALSYEAKTDALTGLNNRRALEIVQEDLERRGITYCFLFMDLDHFKSINDTYGHPKGDEVLRFVAEVLRTTAREEDLCVRYGGEEFVVLLPNAKLLSAVRFAERVRKAVERGATPLDVPVTVSIGLAAAAPREDAAAVVRRADEALYRAKTKGRNRIVVND